MRSCGYSYTNSIKRLSEAWRSFDSNIISNSFLQCGILASTTFMFHSTFRPILETEPADPNNFENINHIALFSTCIDTLRTMFVYTPKWLFFFSDFEFKYL